jgi:Rrf2 family transcriptional regulator, iron-sulfur cluster assembly transcription factor|tara:strand:+ start:102 stop:578 length:477 start_codon:yes stop_codon:yes gene_type:complete
MKLTTKGRFAVTAMLDLALNENQSPVKLAQISERQSISLSYLEQLFSKMRKQGLVKSVRGPGGGYLTAINCRNITIKDIIISVDEKIDSTQCKGRENCNEGGRCITHNLWESLNNKILTYLDELTLEKLMESQVDKIENHTQNISLKKANLRIAKGIT